MTTTSHASYTEERPLATKREVIISSIFLVLGSLIAIISFFPLFLIIIPLSLSILLFREWKMVRNLKELKERGIIEFEPKYRTNRREANRSLFVVISLIATPMILAEFMPPLPWLSLTMAFVMAWPLSNICEVVLQLWIERTTRRRIRKFYKWVALGKETLMKEYGWKLEGIE
ncbi:hypothetical protein GWK48_06895 [Metallosphaera tengchongensis]|uniref:Uncharacterized protein n=1 Tax=Metallosphaera tengchongensis TaxID=1532350 RepID=A0A6N0NVA9_9CREN|nr:hypothetical protein [Metallosphaera tengchongensis]QKR00137.1 hypothetical protein GWK48_06895 [Metallosphaera tengchongensis]